MNTDNMTVSLGATVLSLQEKWGAYAVMVNGFSWLPDGREPCVYPGHGKPAIPFSSARTAKSEIIGDRAIKTVLTGFGDLPITVILTAEILAEGKIDLHLEAEGDEGCGIDAYFFPMALNAAEGQEGFLYTVEASRQGFILPDNYAVNRAGAENMANYRRDANSGESYLPIFGRVCAKNGLKGNAVCGIIDDANDTAMLSSIGRNGALLTSVCNKPSLGKVGYRRTVHLFFYDNADYSAFAKQFRAQEIEKGHLKTLKEKIAENPNVAKLIGSPVYHTRIFSNVQPESMYYKKDGKNSVLHSTFEKKGEQLRRFKRLGLEHLYMHTDGWGELGYDNGHPYVLPPCPQAGGFEGMKKLSETCAELNYVFGLHDQYRDYYYTSPKFDMELAVTEENGEHPYCDIWAGGKHTWLCASQALPFVKTTYTELENHGVSVGGTYLDVFGIVAGDECFNPRHRITRTESIAYRKSCFDWLREKGLIVSSEECGHLLVSAVDLVHHSPYMVSPQDGGPGVGIAIPLTNMVYHECVFVPWIVNGKGGWGIPDGDEGKLHCILNGQTPYLTESPDDKKMSEIIAETQKIADIEALVWDAELVSHEFTDSSMRRRKSTFSNGVSITADFDSGEYSIEK